MMDEQQTTDESTALIVQATNIKTILDNDSYQRAVLTRGKIKEWMNYHEGRLQPLIDESNRHTANLRDELRTHYDPLEEKYDYLGELLGAFDTRMENEKKERELEVEAKDRSDGEERRDRLVVLAAEIGDEQLAEALKTAPLELPPRVITKETPKMPGISYSDHVHYEVRDLMALIKAVAAGKVAIQAIASLKKPFRSAYLNSQATALYETTTTDKDGLRWLYDGVRVWSTHDPVQKL